MERSSDGIVARNAHGRAIAITLMESKTLSVASRILRRG